MSGHARQPRRIGIFRKPQSFGPVTATPLPAAILTIDAATRSGVAVYVRGKLHWYGEVGAHRGPDRRRVMRDAMTVAEVRGLPLACVMEVPFGGRASAALSLTAVCALWRDTWLQCGQRRERLLEYTVSEWRRQLFGSAGMPREEARKLEAVVAQRTATRDMPQQRHYTIGGDAAAAICIGQVAIRSGAVASVLGLSTTNRTHTV